MWFEAEMDLRLSGEEVAEKEREGERRGEIEECIGTSTRTLQPLSWKMREADIL